MTGFDWVFPLMAATIYICTPNGCDKKINWALTGLFVLIWSFEEAIVRINETAITPIITDGLWFDGVLMLLFLSVGVLFYLLKGKIQFQLSLVGAFICLVFAYLGSTGLYYDEFFRRDYYYVEIMIALYIAQLFISGGGMVFALSNKIVGGGNHGLLAGGDRNIARNNNANNGHPKC